MKKLLFVLLPLLLSCGSNNSQSPDYQRWNDDYNPRSMSPERDAYSRYNDCMQQTRNHQMCSETTNVVIHEDQGNRFFEYMGEYYLLSSMINGRSFDYYNRYSYYPSLGYGRPNTTIVHNYVSRYDSLPPSQTYYQSRQQTQTDRNTRAMEIRQERNRKKEQLRVAEERTKERKRLRDEERVRQEKQKRPDEVTRQEKRRNEEKRDNARRNDDTPKEKKRSFDRPREERTTPKSSSSSSSSSSNSSKPRSSSSSSSSNNRRR